MAIAYKNSAAANASSTSVTTTGVNMSDANFFVVFVTMDNGTFAATPVQDSQGNSYTAVATTYSNAGRSIACYFAKNATAGVAQTFTANRTTSGGITIAALGFGSVHTTAPHDGNSPQGNADIFKTTLAASASLTPSEDNEVVISACYHGQTSASQNDGTLTQVVNHDGGNEESIAAAYVVQTTATAVNPTWNGGAESIYMGVMNVAFKQGAAPPTPTYEIVLGEAHRPYPFKPCGDAFRPLAYRGWR